MRAGTWRTILIYGLALAAGAVLLQWLEFVLIARTHPGELWIAMLAVGFMGFGIWVGAKLFRRPAAGGEFERNTAALASLRVSDRELEVLELLAAGASNKEIAAKLSVSPNTVKTHVARLFEKLEASRRTEAIARARELGVIR